MYYSIEIYDKAQDEISKRYNKAVETNNIRIAEIRRKAPEIAKLSDSLLETSVRLTQAIINGGDRTAQLIDEIKSSNLETQRTIRELLKEFSYPEDYLEVPYTCKKCKDSGSVMGKRCDCFNELLIKLSVEELNAKSKITLHDFNEFKLDYYPVRTSKGINAREQMLEVFDFCKEYAESFGSDSPSLIFKGGTGLGKTFLSSAIAKNLTERGYSVVFDSIQNIMRAIENEHFGRSNEDTMSVLLDADLIILDDLGSEFITNFSGSVIYNILNDRINMCKPVIISTNFTTAELNEKYNDRIISRISSFVPVYFEGNDIRQIVVKY